MRDLKHLIYFENLLENADNELVKQAQADGKLAVGYTCYHVPEALLNVGNCFSVRLRAPRTGSLDIATYYMSNYTCEFARALVERGMEGGFQFLDALAGVDACSMMNRAMEHFEILQLNSKPNFFVSHCDIPYKITDYTLDSYVSQMRIHVLDELKNRYGVDTSDDAIRAAVAQHNEVCRIISEIGEMRKADNPVITGYEFHVLNLVTYTCPKDLILPYLRETLEELKARQPDEKPAFRARVTIVGVAVLASSYVWGISQARDWLSVDSNRRGNPLTVMGRAMDAISDDMSKSPSNFLRDVVSTGTVVALAPLSALLLIL